MLAPEQGAGSLLYDFQRPTKLPREQLRVLQMCFETYAKRLTTLLTSGLRQVCVFSVENIDQLSYEEYITSLPSPTVLAPLSLEPLSGTGVLEFAVSTAMTCVDHLLGGPGGEQPNRLPTEIETSLLRGLIDQMLGVLRYAMELVVELRPVLGTLEYNPQFAQAASAQEPVLVARFSLTVGDAEATGASLCLPLQSIGLAVAASLSQPVSDHDQEAAGRAVAASRLRETIDEVPVDVSIRLAGLAMHPLAILGLQPGDVLPLRHRVTTPLTVQSSGVTFAYAVAGRSGDQLAALVVENPEETS